jgi:hypothetical protein
MELIEFLAEKCQTIAREVPLHWEIGKKKINKE